MRLAACLGAAIGALAAGAALAAATDSGLRQIESGLWQIKEDDGHVREICLADGAALIQLQHDGASCSRFVIAGDGSGATIHYSCPGAGWGRTTIRLSSPRAASINSQGIAGNAPFAFTAEARRVGDCKPAPSSSNHVPARSR